MLETLDSGMLAALVLTSGLGSALVLLGLNARVLDKRRERKRCAACGRALEEDSPCRCRR